MLLYSTVLHTPITLKSVQLYIGSSLCVMDWMNFFLSPEGQPKVHTRFRDQRNVVCRTRRTGSTNGDCWAKRYPTQCLYLSISSIFLVHTDHRYFTGVQYHPEYLTRPMKPSPPYLGLILAASNKLDLFISRGCLPSPRSSYEYDYDADMDDEVTQALRQDPLKSSSIAVSPLIISLR